VSKFQNSRLLYISPFSRFFRSTVTGVVAIIIYTISVNYLKSRSIKNIFKKIWWRLTIQFRQDRVNPAAFIFIRLSNDVRREPELYIESRTNWPPVHIPRRVRSLRKAESSFSQTFVGRAVPIEESGYMGGVYACQSDFLRPGLSLFFLSDQASSHATFQSSLQSPFCLLPFYPSPKPSQPTFFPPRPFPVSFCLFL